MAERIVAVGGSLGVLSFGRVWGVVLVVCLCVMVLPVSVWAQSEKSEVGKSRHYRILCLLKKDSKNKATLHYSASSDDVFEVKKGLGNVVFRVLEIGSLYKEEGPQFLKGVFFDKTGFPFDWTRGFFYPRKVIFDESLGADPIEISIPGDREDEYRREDGMREIWFVPSAQWDCRLFRTRERDGRYAIFGGTSLRFVGNLEDHYKMKCLPGKHIFRERQFNVHYSASSEDVFEVLDLGSEGRYWFKMKIYRDYVDKERHNAPRSDGFTALGFADEGETGRQFLQGFIYDGNKSFHPTSYFVPEERADKYRRDDGMREIWFVPSNKWVCYLLDGF